MNKNSITSCPVSNQVLTSCPALLNFDWIFSESVAGSTQYRRVSLNKSKQQTRDLFTLSQPFLAIMV